MTGTHWYILQLVLLLRSESSRVAKFPRRQSLHSPKYFTHSEPITLLAPINILLLLKHTYSNAFPCKHTEAYPALETTQAPVAPLYKELFLPPERVFSCRRPARCSRAFRETGEPAARQQSGRRHRRSPGAALCVPPTPFHTPGGQCPRTCTRRVGSGGTQGPPRGSKRLKPPELDHNAFILLHQQHGA